MITRRRRYFSGAAGCSKKKLMIGRVSVDFRPTWTSKKPIRWLIRKPTFPLPTLDHGCGRAPVLGETVGVQRQGAHHALGEAVPGRLGIRALDLDLDVQPAGVDWRSGPASRAMRSSSAWEITSAPSPPRISLSMTTSPIVS